MGVGCDWVAPRTRTNLESRFSYIINVIIIDCYMLVSLNIMEEISSNTLYELELSKRVGIIKVFEGSKL